MVRKFSLVLALLFAFAAPAWADFYSGVAAYKRGDYKAAFREFKIEAEQGDAVGQFSLGGMYDRGRGVPRNYAMAAKWYSKAAEQGLAVAQRNLGLMYYKGQGVTRNFICSYMWLSLASAQGDSTAAKSVDALERRIKRADVLRAQRLAAAWMPGSKACRQR